MNRHYTGPVGKSLRVSNSRASGIIGKGTLFSLAGVVVLGGLGAYAYMRLTARSGEAALSLLPDEVGAFISVDLSPTVSQASAFKKLTDAFNSTDLESELHKMESHSPDPVYRAVAGHMSRGLAAGYFPTGRRQDWVVLLGLDDEAPVKDALKANSQLRTENGNSYYATKDGTFVEVIQGNFVISDNPGKLSEVAAVADGKATSVTASPQYKVARADLDPDSNFMAFAKGDAIKQWEDKLPKDQKSSAKALEGVSYLAFGVAIRDNGFTSTSSEAFDNLNAPTFKAYSEIKPVNPKTLSSLPAGAYGAMAASNYGEAMETLYLKDANGSIPPIFQKGLADFQKSTGIDVQSDIVPALKGTASVAVYPSLSGKPGVDFVILLDNTNEAQPALLAGKLKAALEKSFKQAGGSGELFAEENVGGAQAEVVLPSAIKSVRQQNRPVRPTFNPNAHQPIPPAYQYQPPTGPMGDIPDNLSPAFALVDGRLVIAGSKEMLAKEIGILHGQGATLATDPAFQKIAENFNHSQSAVVVNFASIAKGIDDAIEPKGHQSDPNQFPKSLLDAFMTLDSPATFFVSTTSNRIVTTGFMPIDYDKLAKAIKGGLSEFSNPPTPPGQAERGV